MLIKSVTDILLLPGICSGKISQLSHLLEDLSNLQQQYGKLYRGKASACVGATREGHDDPDTAETSAETSNQRTLR